MKYLRIYIFLFLYLGVCLHLYSQDTIVKYVVVRDTVYVKEPKKIDDDRILKVKPVGRYDRGISNYRFVSKNKWIGGVTFSVYNFENDNSRLLFSLLKDVNLNLKYTTVNPFVGYAISDNQVVGLKLGYSRISGGLGNLSMNIEDLDLSLSDIKYSDDSYSFNLFYRSYVGLDPDGIFALFNETTLGYVSGSSRFSNGKGEDLSYTDTTVNKLKLGINPGIAIFIMPNVGAEVSFGVAGFSYSWESQKKSTGEVGKRTSSGANFKINLFNINIGLIVCL